MVWVCTWAQALQLPCCSVAPAQWATFTPWPQKWEGGIWMKVLQSPAARAGWALAPVVSGSSRLTQLEQRDSSRDRAAERKTHESIFIHIFMICRLGCCNAHYLGMTLKTALDWEHGSPSAWQHRLLGASPQHAAPCTASLLCWNTDSRAQASSPNPLLGLTQGIHNSLPLKSTVSATCLCRTHSLLCVPAPTLYSKLPPPHPKMSSNHKAGCLKNSIFHFSLHKSNSISCPTAPVRLSGAHAFKLLQLGWCRYPCSQSGCDKESVVRLRCSLHWDETPLPAVLSMQDNKQIHEWKCTISCSVRRGQ